MISTKKKAGNRKPHASAFEQAQEVSQSINKQIDEQIEKGAELMEQEKNTVLNMAEQAMRNYEQAFRTGIKFQEEAGQQWSAVLSQSAISNDWQKGLSQWTRMIDSMMPAAQKRMEEVVDLVDKNARTGAELMKKVSEAATTPAIAESQAKWMEVLKLSLGATRSNAEVIMQFSTRNIDSWFAFIQKTTEMAQPRVSITK